MIACSVNGQGHVRCPLGPLNSTVISNRCLNNNLREMIKFHFLKLLPKVRIWNFNQNTFTTFHQNSYRIVNCTESQCIFTIRDPNPNPNPDSGFHGSQVRWPACPNWFQICPFQWSIFGPLSRWGSSIGGDFLVLVGGRFPWLWIWGGWSKSRDRSGLLCHTTFDHSNMVKNLGQRSNNQILSKLFTAVLCMRKWLRIHDRSRFIIRVNIFFHVMRITNMTPLGN